MRRLLRVPHASGDAGEKNECDENIFLHTKKSAQSGGLRTVPYAARSCSG
jgi:hypothetical protein